MTTSIETHRRGLDQTLAHKVTGMDVRLLSRPFNPRASSQRCPTCDSIIYSRRHKHCGVCGFKLPADRLFTDTEAQAVENLLNREKQLHRQWVSKVFAQSVAILL